MGRPQFTRPLGDIQGDCADNNADVFREMPPESDPNGCYLDADLDGYGDPQPTFIHDGIRHASELTAKMTTHLPIRSFRDLLALQRTVRIPIRAVLGMRNRQRRRRLCGMQWLRLFDLGWRQQCDWWGDCQDGNAHLCGCNLFIKMFAHRCRL